MKSIINYYYIIVKNCFVDNRRTNSYKYVYDKFHFFFFVLIFFISHCSQYGENTTNYIQNSKIPQNVSPIKYFWPAYREYYPQIPYVSSTFGESRKDHFHNGLDLAGVSKAVHPLAKGYLLYSYYSTDDPYKAERGPGNIAFIDQ